MIYKLEHTETAAPIFQNWQETLIWSCLDKTMGRIYAEDLNTPASAMAILGDFCFFAGTPNRELVSYKPEDCTQDFIIIVPQTSEWAALIEKYYGQNAKKVTRYAIKKETNIFDKDKLQHAVSILPDGYSLKRIDKDSFLLCQSEGWSRDLVSQYPDYNTYKKLGIGFVIYKDNQIVSGASSYSRYRDGIEIEIDTREDYRKQGLAYACGAKLILECLSQNLYPSWDAQNKFSVALAEKLGYHYECDYTAYEITNY